MKSMRIKNEFHETRDQSHVNAPKFHLNYEVRNDRGKISGRNLLILYFGNLWESALDRLDHQIDGFIMTINHQDRKFKVYRKINDERHLRLMKS